MRDNSKAVTRAFYIILVPLVALIILLNSGWLQRFFTAVTLDGEDYSAARYNYYYFQAYRAFVDGPEFDGSGLNLSASLSGQQYDENTTWKEHFAQQAEERLILAAHYGALAEEAEYQFSEEELAPAQEKLDEIADFCAETGIKESNYFTAYYGAGMTKAIFTQELERETKADAYRAYLARGGGVSDGEITTWLTANPTEDHPLANLWLYELDPVPARADGAVGERQRDDLARRLERLEARMEGGLAVEDAARYADALWGEDGFVRNAGQGDLPDAVAAWCFGGAQPGAFAGLMAEDGSAGYLVLLDSLDGSSAEKTARLALAEQALEEEDAQTLADARLEYHAFGMQLATA